MRATVTALIALTAVALSSRLGAQGVRWTATSVANYVELRPVAADSIPDSLTTGTGLVRSSGLGLVSCPAGHDQCYFYQSLDRIHTIPFTQDVTGTAWGLGQGVSVYAHFRAASNLGGLTQLWTGEEDHFATLAAYVELNRDQWTARAGRQWLTSQLGVNNYDGASFAIRPARGVTLEAYGGRALVQGLSQPYTSGELASADNIPPDDGGLIFGVTGSWRASAADAINAEYQRVIRADRAGFYSDRASVDAVYTLDGTILTLQSQIDLATTAINEFVVRASRPFSARVGGSIEYRHSTPFFPLWTIWGVFSPVGFNEARGDGRWQSADGKWWTTLGGGYRQYQDTHTGVGFLPLRDNGWTLLATGGWRPGGSFDVNGSYRRDIGPGASKSDGSAGVRWTRSDDRWLGITASATQNIFEYRLANGYLLGAMLDAGIPLTPSLRIVGQVGAYQQIASNTPSTTVNWTQRRALLRLEWSGGGAQ
ncbi:MAG TPA: hypothetical protein VI259_10610 [Gemmatimonadaceae bacterium]